MQNMEIMEYRRQEFGLVMADGDATTGVADGPLVNGGGVAMADGGEYGPEDGICINKLLGLIIS
jgi:hypothetical protein